MEQSFELHTWQNPSWDITKEKCDPSKGYPAWKDTWEELQPLYEKLEKKIKTRDFIWCSPAYDYWNQEIRRLWVLDVDNSKVFHILRTSVWNKLLENAGIDETFENILLAELILERSNGIQRLSEEDKGIQVLVRVPLCTSKMVIDKSRFSKGNHNGDVKYEDLPTSECEAKRLRDEESTKYIR